MIQISDLSFGYPGGGSVFTAFNLLVEPGEALAILGPSGCGKTTLLYLLAGLKKPASGEIRILGELLERPRPKTGMVLQDFGLLPWATVEENVLLGWNIRNFYGPDERHAPAGESIGAISEHILPWIQRLGLSDLRKQYPSQLSGGQRQRTAIARTLSLTPDLLLMDEPFASLDAPTRESLQDLILALRVEQLLTTVIVTHAIEEAAILGQRILILPEPPNSTMHWIANPDSGKPAFRGSKAYHTICNTLRAAMEPTR